MEKRNIKLTLAYDGTDFAGFQMQEDQRTVQGEIVKALETMHKHPMSTVAAGRTDAGVHARGQVMNFFTDIHSIPEWKFRDAINFYLPKDISILQSEEVHRDFSARFSARRRVYRYYFYISPVELPWLSRFATRRRRFPDINRINQMAAHLLGDQDFSTFAASGDSSKSKQRILLGANFYIEGQFLVFKIEADSFLYKMVRSLVGTMLEFHDNNRSAQEFKEILLAKKRKLAGVTAPAKGLFLEKVYYGDEPDFMG